MTKTIEGLRVSATDPLTTEIIERIIRDADIYEKRTGKSSAPFLARARSAVTLDGLAEVHQEIKEGLAEAKVDKAWSIVLAMLLAAAAAAIAYAKLG